MKRYLAVMTAVIIACGSMLGGSALALNNEETVPETPSEVSAETAFTEDSIAEDSAQQETADTIPEVKEPVTLENLSPEARAKIDDEFYEMLKNADEDEIFEYMVMIAGDMDEAENYRYPYDKSEYNWREACGLPDDYIEENPIVAKRTYGVCWGWHEGETEDVFFFYAEKAKAIRSSHEFMKNTYFSIIRSSTAYFDFVKLTKSQILELLEDENVKGFATFIAPSF